MSGILLAVSRCWESCSLWLPWMRKTLLLPPPSLSPPDSDGNVRVGEPPSGLRTSTSTSIKISTCHRRLISHVLIPHPLHNCADTSLLFDTIQGAGGHSIKPVQPHRQCLPLPVPLCFLPPRPVGAACRMVKLNRCDCIRFSPDSSTPLLPWMHSIIIRHTLYQEVSSCQKCKWKLGSLSGKWVWWWQEPKQMHRSETRFTKCCWKHVVWL